MTSQITRSYPRTAWDRKWHEQYPGRAFQKELRGIAREKGWQHALNRVHEEALYADTADGKYNVYQEFGSMAIPPHEVDRVVDSMSTLHPIDKNAFFHGLNEAIRTRYDGVPPDKRHIQYSHDQLMNFWEKSGRRKDIGQSIVSHPNYALSNEEFNARKAGVFWKNYEVASTANHFAAIRSLFSGKEESIIDHLGHQGTSGLYANVIPHLNSHAKRVQDAVMQDKNIKKKFFNGKPYVKLYRGVKGGYGEKIRKAAGMDDDKHSIEDRTLSIPTAPAASWTTSRQQAEDFSTMGQHATGLFGHGVVLAAWHPVDSILHSGYHCIYPGVENSYPDEQEIVVSHPTEKMRVKTKNMLFQRRSTFNGILSSYVVQAPLEIRPKPFRKSDIFDFIDAHEELFRSDEDQGAWRHNTDEDLENEYRWEYQNHWAHTGLFPTVSHFKQAVKRSPVVEITPQMDRVIGNRSRTRTVDELKGLTSTYRYPRDVDSIVRGLASGGLPHPIVIKHGGRHTVMSGNTRMDAAFIHGINPHAIVVDMDQPQPTELGKSEGGGPVRLVHYSHLSGLTRLDPKFYGTGHRGAEHRRAPGPRTFYYLEGTKPEDVIAQRAPHKYVAELPEGHRIYDVGTDPHGVIVRAAEQAKNRQVNPGILTPEDKEEAVRSAGYHGMYDSTHPQVPNAVAYFHPLDVKEEK